MRLLCDASIFIRPLHIAGRSFCSGLEVPEAFELCLRVRDVSRKGGSLPKPSRRSGIEPAELVGPLGTPFRLHFFGTE